MLTAAATVAAGAGASVAVAAAAAAAEDAADAASKRRARAGRPHRGALLFSVSAFLLIASPPLPEHLLLGRRQAQLGVAELGKTVAPRPGCACSRSTPAASEVAARRINLEHAHALVPSFSTQRPASQHPRSQLLSATASAPDAVPQLRLASESFATGAAAAEPERAPAHSRSARPASFSHTTSMPAMKAAEGARSRHNAPRARAAVHAGPVSPHIPARAVTEEAGRATCARESSRSGAAAASAAAQLPSPRRRTGALAHRRRRRAAEASPCARSRSLQRAFPLRARAEKVAIVPSSSAA